MIFGLGLEKAGNNPPVMKRAFELGVRFFDTAPLYSNGRNEGLFGEALKLSGIPRNEVVISTKSHYRDPAQALALLERSLRELRTDYVDIWNLHDLATPYDIKILPALDAAKKSGKVKYVGITCNRDPFLLRDVLKVYTFDYAMMTMNIADKHQSSFIMEVLPNIDRTKTKLIAMQVFMRGKSQDQVLPYFRNITDGLAKKFGKSLDSGHPECPTCVRTPLDRVAYLTKPVTAKWVCPKCGYKKEEGALEVFQIYQDCLNYVASYNPDVVLLGCNGLPQLEEDWVAFNNIIPLAEADKKVLEGKTRPFATQLNYFKNPLNINVLKGK
jgi:diketogulonate reductase-like aldo/keto reductase